ncbi:MAG: hypothetical protein ACLKAK_04985 [Alkaliphilus sp.]
MSILVLVEVSKKQEYIFASNRVKENIGASIIIEHITGKLATDEMEENRGKKILSGGGKSIFQFSVKENAICFAKNLTKLVLKEFSGVELFVVSIDFDFEKAKAEEVMKNLYKKLENKKNRRKTSCGVIGLGIEKICQSTGKVAVDKSCGRFVASDIKVKEEFSDRENVIYSNLIGRGYELTTDIDKLLSKESDKSFIAIVHIDGNQMGNKFVELQKHFEGSSFENTEDRNKKYFNALEILSDDIDEAYKESFKEMCVVIEKNKDRLKNDTNISKGIFPLRPLILAGDDITYISNGKIGLESARIFIEKLNKKTVTIGTKSVALHACAGIALVKLKYPFFKAYQLAEELCANGKKTILNNYEGDCSMIDWHIEYGEIADSLDEIRRENYVVRDEKNNELTLNMRPVYVNVSETKKWNTYNNFKKSLDSVTKKDVSRNKIKKLREVFFLGKEETEKFVRMNKLDESVIHRLEGTKGDFGFSEDNVCMYYDAIEVMDVFQELVE